ncbi:16S rRNA processing protein rimM [Spiroplasma sabaudiense Ar-1343]|uniref:Ribosome maturation factor RimM n=1 Tax=Spiroplasma sabaudiense Ar-1343 TaxID=1276257 RepID=W6A9Z5_9MOLU|nr:ribosome maturation factor RimM [Spiroplasma sabaudiense]AHI53680.1 16S rRNA processing protein rimM [Spiroplasma sabaudiense Ar-1343]
MDFKENLKYVGRISTSHGIKGELKFKIDSSYQDLEKWDNQVLYLEDSKKLLVPVIIEKSYYKNKHLIIKLKNYNSISEVQNLINCLVQIVFPNDLVVKIKTLVGYKVDFNGKNIGVVSEELSNSAQKLIRINIIDSSKSFLVPLVDYFIKSIDDKVLKVFSQNIEGLM